jgi:hypothetical protein
MLNRRSSIGNRQSRVPMRILPLATPGQEWTGESASAEVGLALLQERRDRFPVFGGGVRDLECGQFAPLHQ